MLITELYIKNHELSSGHRISSDEWRGCCELSYQKKKAQMYKINDTKVDWKSKQCKGQRKKKTVSKIPTVLKLCHRAHCHLMITSGLAARDSAGMTIYVLNCKEMNQTISGEIV